MIYIENVFIHVSLKESRCVINIAASQSGTLDLDRLDLKQRSSKCSSETVFSHYALPSVSRSCNDVTSLARDLNKSLSTKIELLHLFYLRSFKRQAICLYSHRLSSFVSARCCCCCCRGSVRCCAVKKSKTNLGRRQLLS